MRSLYYCLHGVAFTRRNRSNKHVNRGRNPQIIQSIKDRSTQNISWSWWHHTIAFNWVVCSNEQMSKGWPCVTCSTPLYWRRNQYIYIFKSKTSYQDRIFDYAISRRSLWISMSGLKKSQKVPIFQRASWLAFFRTPHEKLIRIWNTRHSLVQRLFHREQLRTNRKMNQHTYLTWSFQSCHHQIVLILVSIYLYLY